jgi:dTDP-glucose 4,6-dehydratase
MNNNNFNLLVTGGCGFIGSNFINYYFNKYDNLNIICIDIMYYCASLNNINENIRKSNRFKFIQGNICNYYLIKYILEEYKINKIIHFAAQSHVDNSFNETFKYIQDNIIGTYTILEAIKNVNKDIFLLHFSTDEVYGETNNDDIKHEQSILCPTNPYSATKASAEMLVFSYIYSFKLNVIITRGNNVYGVNQYPEKLIPKFINLLKNNKKCTIAGDGSSIRNFINVYDVCTAVDIIINNGTIGEIYNIGGEASNEYSVIEVAKKLIKLIKTNINDDDYINYIEYVEDRPFNDKRYFISNDKLTLLGWKQTISFDDGIKNLIDN